MASSSLSVPRASAFAVYSGVSEETAGIYLPGGELPEIGDRLANPDLARTLEIIAREGPDGFYRGPVAEAIAGASRAAGGSLTAADLAGYRARVTEPLSADVADARVFSAPPPANGGATLLAALVRLVVIGEMGGYAGGAPSPRVGYIPVDSVHSPVRKVNYVVEDARLGQTTDYDKLTLEVWTNGSINPQDSVAQAAKLLKDHTAIFINFEEAPEEELDFPTTEDERLMEQLSRSVDELELSVRSYNCLKNANIRTLRDLVGKQEKEMVEIRNFGEKSLKEVREKLEVLGLGFGMNLDM